VALIKHTVTGKMFLPDGVTPLVGTWYFQIISSSGMVLDHDYEGFRYGVAAFATSPTGDIDIELPATTQPDSEPSDYFYSFWFVSTRGTDKIDKQVTTLVADSTIDEILETPFSVPVTPSQVTQVLEAAEAATAAAASAAYSAQQAAINADINTGGIATQITNLQNDVADIREEITVPNLVLLLQNALI
jgi:hypothetical protein